MIQQLHLTDVEIKNAYYGAWNKPDPHFEGLKAVSVAQTAKIEEGLKENREVENASQN